MPVFLDLELAVAPRAGAICAGMKRVGIEAEPFGSDQLRVTAVPAILKSADPHLLAMEVLDLLAQGEEGERAYDALLYRMACRAAVKAGHGLTAEELGVLLRAAAEVDFAAHCPHGRPTWIHWDMRSLDKSFKRIV
jgi:DNA mismatch repair protein MutL